ncbi:hypothetical protein BDP27DRAFT_106304 [Rhodocollybia butyracea]|uniref:Uncharacterized protein n=1 Tax=Rhodocollybia butyracea TaxID=206335 RepID=A0A9P5TVQ6_9AGAR|nr:hypothetical protein BDP27DRAFT_106304 [Rhodocollybia butyracea]
MFIFLLSTLVRHDPVPTDTVPMFASVPSLNACGVSIHLCITSSHIPYLKQTNISGPFPSLDSNSVPSHVAPDSMI